MQATDASSVPGGISTSNGGSSEAGQGSHPGPSWQAGWVSSELLGGCGIRISRHALADHHVSRLLAVLGGLAAADPSRGRTRCPPCPACTASCASPG